MRHDPRLRTGIASAAAAGGTGPAPVDEVPDDERVEAPVALAEGRVRVSLDRDEDGALQRPCKLHRPAVRGDGVEARPTTTIGGAPAAVTAGSGSIAAGQRGGQAPSAVEPVIG